MNEICIYACPPKMEKSHQQNICIVSSLMQMEMLKYNYAKSLNNKDFSSYICNNLDIDVQIQILQNLRRCKCCIRHQEYKPDIITELEPLEPKTSLMQNNEETIVEASSYIYYVKKEEIVFDEYQYELLCINSYRNRNKNRKTHFCVCPCRHYCRWLYSSILNKHHSS